MVGSVWTGMSSRRLVVRACVGAQTHVSEGGGRWEACVGPPRVDYVFLD